MSTAIEIPASVYRLAKQFDRDPQALAKEIMQAGIHAIDDGLASSSKEPFASPCFVSVDAGYTNHPEFTITSMIERMSPELLADCQKEADECFQTLQEIVRERSQRGVDLKQLAQPVI